MKIASVTNKYRGCCKHNSPWFQDFEKTKDARTGRHGCAGLGSPLRHRNGPSVFAVPLFTPSGTFQPGDPSLPPALVVIDPLEQIAHHPAHGIAQGDGDDAGGQMAHHQQVQLPEKDEGKQHNHHGCPGISDPPEHPGQDLVHAGEDVKKAHTADEQYAFCHHFRLLVEQPHDMRGQEKFRDHQTGGGHKRHGHGHPDPFVDPVRIPGTGVLPGKGGDGQGNALHGHDYEHIHPDIDAPPCRISSAEGIHIGLDEDVGKSRQGHLEPGGQPHIHDFFQHGPVQAHLPPGQGIDLPAAEEHHQHQHRRNELAQDGGVSHTGHSPAEPDDEIQVQHHIQDGGEGQKIQRPFGISHGPQDGGPHVVDHQAGDAGEIDPQIGDGMGCHRRRRLHALHQEGRDGPAQGHEHQGQKECPHQGGMDRPAQFCSHFCPEILGDHHAGPGAHPQEKAHQGVDAGHDGGHPAQGRRTHEIPHHHRIHCIVQLLEQVPEQEGQGKPEKMREDPAPGHILRGRFGQGITPFYFSRLSFSK